MKKLGLKSAVLSVAMAVSTGALAQVQINIGLPAIHFATPPPLVVVQPGVQVVEDCDDEVFYSNGWYWVRRDDRWYRTQDHRGQWVVVERRRVPVSILGVPRGKYRRYKAERRFERKHEKRHHKGHKH